MARDAIRDAIEIVCDGGSSYGFGHILRSYTLAQALNQRGYPVRYRAASERGKALLPRFVSTTHETAVSVLDLPYEIGPWVQRATADKLPTIALDYFGDAEPALVISIYEHRLPAPGGRRVSGLEYALIRPQITKFAPAPQGEGVVVMIGGSDLNRTGERVAEQLADAGSVVNLIQGPAFSGKYSVGSKSVTVTRVPDDLEMRMASCRWSVTNGGTSMMEMMCLGKATHVIPQTAAERRLAEIIFDQGGIMGIGLESLRAPSDVDIARVGARAQAMVDGRGVDRVIGLIEEIWREQV